METDLGNLDTLFGAAVGGSPKVAYGELTLTIPVTSIVPTIERLRDRFEFSCLIDLCGVDFPERPDRFEVVYHLLSPTRNERLRLKVRVADGESVPSICAVFPAANWFEREAFDLYGIPFDGHPDLRRILTDYGFEGHPLRKDFPLTGYVEVRYDDEARKVVYEPVKLPQEFRNFDFVSPWEGTQYELPGDEKAGRK